MAVTELVEQFPAFGCEGCCDSSRAACSHQICRDDAVAARVCSMDSTGVTPTPADIRMTGVSASLRKKAPRGAATSISCPAVT